MALNPTSLLSSPPSFTQASASGPAYSASGGISADFNSGSFSLGGGQTFTWLFVVAGLVLVAWIYYGRKK